MIKENVTEVLKELENGNNLGERINLVLATKTQSVEKINEAIQAGAKIVAENRVQEFNLKHPFLHGAEEQFIGRLQTNKVKYLIGKVSLIQSCDRLEIIDEIAKQSINKKVITNVLLEINIGGEISKSGFNPKDALTAYDYAEKLDGVCVKGFMAMLPLNATEKENIKLCLQMREIYDIIKEKDENITYLSVGMSEDYRTAIKNGSNMIRLGSRIFGKRA